ncbi:MAG: phosphoglucomutase/phosphomannomutase family protein, partial [Alloacidobacterium sp.]
MGNTTAIKFGTDGWRGVIADDFTFANVRTAAAAIGTYVLSKKDPGEGVCIGYDTRFESEAFAHAVAEVLAAAGIPVKIADRITPTPALSFGVRAHAAVGGVMITSSHNPYQWNGVKYKAYYGGSGKPSIISEIEGYLGKPLPKASNAAKIEGTDFQTSYVEAISRFADLD